MLSPRLPHTHRSSPPPAAALRSRVTPLRALLAALALVAVAVVTLQKRTPPSPFVATVAPAVRPVALEAANTAPSFPEPLLTTLELLTLQTYARRAELYVEWGSGASTSLVAPMARRAVSIDNNKEW